MEWAVFSALAGVTASAMLLAWMIRGMLADRDLRIELLEKDVRHLKGNLAQHGVISAEMREDFIRTQEEVKRLGKLVNGHHR